jgi:hypothetical protein
MEEQVQQAFDLKFFLAETRDIIVNPAQFFAAMKKDGGLLYPVIKVIIYAVVSAILSGIVLWFPFLRLFSPGVTAFGAVTGAVSLVMSPVFAVIGLFVLAVIIMAVSSFAAGNANFDSCTRVAAALAVISLFWPVGTLFHFVNIYLGALISLAISAYFLWLFYLAMVNALAAKAKTAKIMTLVFAGLTALWTVSSLAVMTFSPKSGSSDKTSKSVETMLYNKTQLANIKEHGELNTPADKGAEYELMRKQLQTAQNNLVEAINRDDQKNINKYTNEVNLALQELGNLHEKQ